MEQGGQLSAGRVMGWRRPAHTVGYARKGQFLRQSSYGLSGGVGGDFRPVGRREALGGGFCAIQRLGGAPAGRQRRIGVTELAGEKSKRYHVTSHDTYGDSHGRDQAKGGNGRAAPQAGARGGGWERTSMGSRNWGGGW